jgi:5S rRNA maturation endonuclease (ribonuclease M5)
VQRLLVTAFRTAFSWWEDFGEEIPEVADLNSIMPLKDFQQLLEKFVTDHANNLRHNPKFEEDVSAVRVEYYLHGPGIELCRDVRYKFDTGSTKTWSDAAACKDTVVAMIEAHGQKLTDLKVEELNELALRYARAFGTEKWNAKMDAKNLWRDNLPVPSAIESAPAKTAQRVERVVVPLDFDECSTRLRTYVKNNVQKGKEAQVMEHVRMRISEINKQGSEKIAKVRDALNALELTPSVEEEEQMFANRYEPETINRELDKNVFGV